MFVGLCTYIYTDFLLLDEGLISGHLQTKYPDTVGSPLPNPYIDKTRSKSHTADTIFSSFTASFLIEALGRGELRGALIAPAGWHR